MNKVKVGIIERFCMYLGRHHIVSDFLDYFSQFLFTPSQLAFSGLGGMPISLKKKANDSDILGHKGQILMSRPPGGSDNFHGNARTTPSHKHGYDDEPTRGFWEWLLGDGVAHDRLKNRDKESQKHSPAPCSDVKYRGMHGRPCLFAGGTDNMCPKGSVSGWWWSYEVPVIGRVYYVDCCGGKTASDIWCQWSSEQDWCLGLGRASARGVTGYTCTLAILEADMNVVAVGSSYEAVGVDPAP